MSKRKKETRVIFALEQEVLIEQRYPSGRVVKNVLDSDGELATVQSKKNANHAFWNYANHFSYSTAGAVTSMQLGNGRWESTQFNSRLQPTQIGLGTTAPSVNGQGQTVYSTDLLKLEYQYGDLEWDGSVRAGSNNGNVAKQTITVQAVGATPGFTAVQNYDYDSLNRIQVASETLTPTTGAPEVWTQQFKYDRFGNRNFVTTGDSATTTLGTCPTEVCNPTISPNDNKISSTGYTFDAAGNTTRDAQNRKFTYGAENKQLKVETVVKVNGNDVVTGTVGEYWFDGDGKRVKKRAYENNVPTEETIFVYNASGKLVGEYSNRFASAQDAKIAYLTNDHLGSPRINTDLNANVTARHDYHPFGDEIESSNRFPGIGYAADTVRKQFTGYERDLESGLDFAQARMFVSQLGRFSTVDPLMLDDKRLVDPQRINLYVYVRNNPTIYKDSGGEDIVLGATDAKEQVLLKEAIAIIARTESGRAMLTEMDNSKVVITMVVGRAVDSSGGENYGKIAGTISGTGTDATGEITLEINPNLIEGDTQKNKDREKQNKEIRGINEAAKAMGKPELKERELIPDVPQGKNANERNAEATGHELSHTKSKINTGKANSEADATKEARGLINDRKKARGKPEEFVEEIVKRRD